MNEEEELLQICIVHEVMTHNHMILYWSITWYGLEWLGWKRMCFEMLILREKHEPIGM